MSDVWQGPGWWLAPDGKWYPEDGGPTDSARPDTGSATPAERGGAQIVETAPSADGAVAAPERPEPAAAADKAAPSEEPRGGWTAVEPDRGDDGELDAGDDGETGLGDDAKWADGSRPEVGDGELDQPEVAATVEPEAPSDTATEPLADHPGVPLRRPADTSTEPIERDDAWRKPGEGGEPLDAVQPSAAPAVVDVTEATDDFVGEPTEILAPSPWRGVLLALGFLAAIIGFSILVGLFFTNVVFNDDDDAVSTEQTTTTDQSAPSTDASTSTESTVVPTTEDPSLGTEVSVFELETGDCIEGDIGSGPLERLVRVDCSVPHQFEVYTEDVLDPSITEFDEEAINAAAEAICRDALDAYIPADDDRNIQFKWFQPTAESWAQEDNPDRAITCLLFDADGPMTGRAA